MTDYSVTLLEALFDRVAALPPHERAAILDAECKGDQDLKAAVEQLLRNDAALGADDRFLEGPMMAARSAVEPVDPIICIEGYRIVRKLGAGGMGSVYEAEQENPRRRVAIKVIRPGLATADTLKRFLLEAQVLGRLNHPGIARIYEAGLAKDGQHFIAMEYVAGLPLREFARKHALDLHARLDLIAHVCDAMQHAHGQGIIHRDLKPANILVDEAGQPRVLDFGVARAANIDLQTTIAQTQAGQVIGTLAYMSPEQIAGDPTRIDHRADVYALGVILFELLAEKTPFHLQNLSLPEVARVICEHEPPALGTFGRVFAGDLETIVAKALQKDAADRYVSAQQLGADLRRYRNGEPIEARPISGFERATRWARLHRGLAASLAVTALLLVATTVGAIVAAFWFEDSARRNAQLADEKEVARKQAELAGKAERWERYRANIATAASALQTHNISTAKNALAAAPVEHRNWEWRHFHSQLDTARLVVKAPVPLAQPVLSADGRRVAAAAKADSIQDKASPHVFVWEIQTGQLLHHVRGPDGGTRNAIRPDGCQAAFGTADGHIRLVDLHSGKIASEFKAHSDTIVALAYSINGKFLATAGKDRAACVWDVEAGRKVASLSNLDGKVISLSLSPDGKRLLVLTSTITLWDVERSERITSLAADTGWLVAHAFSRDGRHVLVGLDYLQKTAMIHDANTGKRRIEISGHQNLVSTGDFSPDGTRVATGSLDQTLRLCDANSGKIIAVLRGHTGWVVRTAFSPDGRLLASAAEDGAVRIWNAKDGGLIEVLRGHLPASLFDLTWSNDSTQIAVTSTDGSLRLWDVPGSAERGVLRGHQGFIYDVACSPDGTQLASAAWDRTVRLWDLASRKQTTLLRHQSEATCVVYAPDGKTLVSVSRHNRVTIWNLPPAESLYTLDFPPEDHNHDMRVTFDSKGLRGAVGTFDGFIRLWDVKTGAFTDSFAAGPAWIIDLAFSPDQTLIASACSDGSIPIWKLDRRQCVQRIRSHSEQVNRVVFDKNGLRLASASNDHTARLWNVETGRELLPPLVHADKVWDAAFSPDGTRLATACNDNTIRLWDLATGHEVAELRGHESYVKSIAFSPDGAKLYSASGDFTIRIWDTTPPQQARQLSRTAVKPSPAKVP